MVYVNGLDPYFYFNLFLMKQIIFDFKRQEDFDNFNDQILKEVRKNFKENKHQGSVIESNSTIKIIVDKM